MEEGADMKEIDRFDFQILTVNPLKSCETAALQDHQADLLWVQLNQYSAKHLHPSSQHKEK